MHSLDQACIFQGDVLLQDENALTPETTSHAEVPFRLAALILHASGAGPFARPAPFTTLERRAEGAIIQLRCPASSPWQFATPYSIQPRRTRMPIHEIVCNACGYSGEVISLSASSALSCPECGAAAEKRISATSPLTGRTGQALPGAGDTGCCGSSPGHAGCAGPGSCCGKA